MSDIQGLDEILAKISGLGGNIKEVCLKASIRGCKTIQKNAKYLCPVDTNQLKNSIKTRGEIRQDEIVSQVYTDSDHWYPEFRYRTKGCFKQYRKT